MPVCGRKEDNEKNHEVRKSIDEVTWADLI